MMRITPTQTTQFADSQAVITAAFATAPHSDGTEGALTQRLRTAADYRPDYDAVAEADDGTVVGCALLSPAHIGATPILILAPVAVAPKWQGQGLGGALIDYLCMQAGENGARAISVFGDPAYYGRFGFELAAPMGITAPLPEADQYLMMRALRPGGLTGVTGAITYHPAFGVRA